eukprot:scaffold219516_cov31-Tisochrysis_lutea.AAC.3
MLPPLRVCLTTTSARFDRRAGSVAHTITTLGATATRTEEVCFGGLSAPDSGACGLDHVDPWRRTLPYRTL